MLFLWIFRSIMNTSDDNGEDFVAHMVKYQKEAKERWKKSASEENPDPTLPNPYEEGTEDWWKYEDERAQSWRNMHAKTKLILGSKARHDRNMETARKRLESRSYYIDYCARRAARLAAQANTNTENKQDAEIGTNN